MENGPTGAGHCSCIVYCKHIDFRLLTVRELTDTPCARTSIKCPRAKVRGVGKDKGGNEVKRMR